MQFHIETEQEVDGRWIAEVRDLPGCLVYGTSHDDAIAKVTALALHILADRLEHGEALPAGASIPLSLAFAEAA